MSGAGPNDLDVAGQRVAALVAGVPGEALDWPTPCHEYTVADLLDHIAGGARAFTAAAVKQPLDGSPSVDGSRLPPDWRVELPKQVMTLAGAWRDPGAWAGMTAAGGVDLPGEVAGVVALDELVIHGWDLAKATDQPADYDGPGLEAVYGMVSHFRTQGLEIFGPPVDVSPEAPLLHRILGASGRDPRWEPPAVRG